MTMYRGDEIYGDEVTSPVGHPFRNEYDPRPYASQNSVGGAVPEPTTRRAACRGWITEDDGWISTTEDAKHVECGDADSTELE
jgi:hypothetical protein